MATLDPLFFPKSIAVIGASNRPLTIGHRIVQNLLTNGFTGTVHPVNPKATPILDLPASPSIKEVPGPVDLAHVIVKNTLVPTILRDCAEAGVKACIVNTSGFKEVGPEGAALEREIVAIGKETGLRLFGPNCQGVMNTAPEVSLYSNFTFARMTPGHISMVCQGGGVAEVINNYFGMHGIGQRMYASNGNACDISIPEIIEYYGQDEETRVIVLHMESFADAEEFLARVAPVAARKPILALKSGTTEQGARAVSSHTGGLMAADSITDALFDRAGVLRFRSLGELCETAEAFATQPVPRSGRIGMVTNAGSPAIIVTDEAVQAGLEVPDLGEAAKAALGDKLQAIASIANPIDMMATAAGPEFGASLDALLGDPGIDAAVVCFMTPFFVDTLSIADAIAEAARTTDKTLVAVAMTDPEGKQEWREAVARVRGAGVPVYYFPATAARVLHHMDRFRRLRDRPVAEPPALPVDTEAAAAALGVPLGDDGYLPPAAAAALLRAYGLPLPEEGRAQSWDDLRAAASRVGYPVVLKAEGPALLHKTDAGAVVLGLADEAALEQAYRDLSDRLADRAPLTFLVQRQVQGGVELIVGGTRAPGMGALVLYGLGGTLVELLEETTVKLAPLSEPQAEEMLEATRASQLVAGFRGAPPADRGALRDVLLRASRLLADHPEIAELDLNPVLALPDGQGAAIVDARIRIESPAR